MCAASNNPPSSWFETTEDELKAFIGINILMGIHRLPCLSDYWSSDPALRVAYVADRMSRNRFEKICQYFQCSSGGDRADKLSKVSPFIQVLQENFPKLLVPWPALSVDEAMIKFNGRLQWKQYMPKKTVKWGIKIWCLCDSMTGYCLAFNIYIGKNNVDGRGLAHRVVMNLMRDYLGKFHHVYADNFFSSIPLVTDLLANNTYYSGTIRKTSKGFPKDILGPKLMRGESKKVGRDRMMVCRWVDKRDVFFISSGHAGVDQVKQRSDSIWSRYLFQMLLFITTKKWEGLTI